MFSPRYPNNCVANLADYWRVLYCDHETSFPQRVGNVNVAAPTVELDWMLRFTSLFQVVVDFFGDVTMLQYILC